MLDRPISHAEVLARIVRCGRASPTWASGRLCVVWEDTDRAPTALFFPGNIVAGSLALDYASGQIAEEIVVRYLEPALDWQWGEVRRLMPGVTTPASTAAVSRGRTAPKG